MRWALLVTVCTFACQLQAQDGDQSVVVLPLEAQTCNLPNAPARVPEDADYEGLKAGKARLTTFQNELAEYRTCLDESRDIGRVTAGNLEALNNAHNYSVDLETRVAEQFNLAVRAYKARQAKD